MTDVFRTFMISAAQGPKAVAICDALGYPDKGMFVSKVADGDPSTAPTIAYISSGWVPDTSPVLKTANELWAALNTPPRSPGTITLADCQAFKSALDLTPAEPHSHAALIVKEVNGTAPTTPWVQPQGAHDAYPFDAGVTHAGKKWRSLVPDNVWQPPINWREFWSSGAPPAWVQPTGAGDAYPVGARVTHNAQVWQSTTPANVWEPGVYGWVVV